MKNEQVPEHMISQYVLLRDAKGETYSLSKFTDGEFKVLAGDLERKDIVKIMDDCSKWLDEEEQR